MAHKTIFLDYMTLEFALLGKLTWKQTYGGSLSSILPIALVELVQVSDRLVLVCRDYEVTCCILLLDLGAVV